MAKTKKKIVWKTCSRGQNPAAAAARTAGNEIILAAQEISDESFIKSLRFLNMGFLY